MDLYIKNFDYLVFGTNLGLGLVYITYTSHLNLNVYLYKPLVYKLFVKKKSKKKKFTVTVLAKSLNQRGLQQRCRDMRESVFPLYHYGVRSPRLSKVERTFNPN